jgi:hypothetical protein
VIDATYCNTPVERQENSPAIGSELCDLGAVPAACDLYVVTSKGCARRGEAPVDPKLVAVSIAQLMEEA